MIDDPDRGGPPVSLEDACRELAVLFGSRPPRSAPPAVSRRPDAEPPGAFEILLDESSLGERRGTDKTLAEILRRFRVIGNGPA